MNELTSVMRFASLEVLFDHQFSLSVSKVEMVEENDMLVLQLSG